MVRCDAAFVCIHIFEAFVIAVRNRGRCCTSLSLDRNHPGARSPAATCLIEHELKPTSHFPSTRECRSVDGMRAALSPASQRKRSVLVGINARVVSAIVLGVACAAARGEPQFAASLSGLADDQSGRSYDV